jgi:hypothetical protein
MIRPRVSALAFSGALLIAALSAGPASGTTILAEHYSGTDSYSYTCGAITVDVDVTFSGVAHIRVGSGKDATAFFAHDNYEVTEVHTASTGEVLILSANGLFQETRATRVDDSPVGEVWFAFSSVNAGQPFVVSDADGNVLIRDRGTIRETIVFNTEGDDVPGGIFIESVSLEVAGPHPVFFDGFDPCDYFG